MLMWHKLHVCLSDPADLRGCKHAHLEGYRVGRECLVIVCGASVDFIDFILIAERGDISKAQIYVIQRQRGGGIRPRPGSGD